MITVVDYDPTWPGQFEQLRAGYQDALVGVPILGIEHVGSTSVPGLAAKPVIDVDIIVTADHVRAAIEAMESAGFESLGEQGITDRWAVRAPFDRPSTNTYVVVDGSLALRNHLGVRNALRHDDRLRDEYAATKRETAARVDDIDQYVEQKSAFLSSILERAGLTGAERQSIKDANRAT